MHRDRLKFTNAARGRNRRKKAMTNDVDFGPSTKEIQQALARVLDYLEHDERKDYESNPRKGHIYQSVKLLRSIELLAK
jgi:hypothetical protein